MKIEDIIDHKFAVALFGDDVAGFSVARGGQQLGLARIVGTSSGVACNRLPTPALVLLPTSLREPVAADDACPVSNDVKYKWLIERGTLVASVDLSVAPVEAIGATAGRECGCEAPSSRGWSEGQFNSNWQALREHYQREAVAGQLHYMEHWENSGSLGSGNHMYIAGVAGRQEVRLTAICLHKDGSGCANYGLAVTVGCNGNQRTHEWRPQHNSSVRQVCGDFFGWGAAYFDFTGSHADLGCVPTAAVLRGMT